MVRGRDVDGPWVPGAPVRFEWLPEDHPDEKMVRERVQDGGVNLFVLRLPVSIAGTDVKVLAVGFYPDELQSASWHMCDPRQQVDWNLGGLVVLKTLELNGTFEFGGGHLGSVNCYMGPLTDEMIAEIKRNNRNARQDLKRKMTASYLEQEIRNAKEAEEERKMEESGFLDAYTEAYLDTERHVRGNPFVSGYNPN